MPMLRSASRSRAGTASIGSNRIRRVSAIGPLVTGECHVLTETGVSPSLSGRSPRRNSPPQSRFITWSRMLCRVCSSGANRRARPQVSAALFRNPAF